mgnify:CR=1 FL=1
MQSARHGPPHQPGDRRPRLSRTFRDLAHVFPPHAIRDPADYDETVGRMEALLRLTRRTAAQEQFKELSKQLDRLQYKFQNRKKIWLRWLEESHHLSGSPNASPGPS